MQGKKKDERRFSGIYIKRGKKMRVGGELNRYAGKSCRSYRRERSGKAKDIRKRTLEEKEKKLQGKNGMKEKGYQKKVYWKRKKAKRRRWSEKQKKTR